MTIAALPLAHAVPFATAAQMAEADRNAVELGIPLEALMENAAHRIAVVARHLLGGGLDGADVVAVAGTGNNGGDALAALRHLHGWGAAVEALVAAPRGRLRPLAALQHDVLVRMGIPARVTTDADGHALRDRLGRAALVLDGLLGYSASGAPRGEVARLIRLLPRTRVLAVDIPSGLDPDRGSVADDLAVTATVTVTLALPKPGLLAPTAPRWVGELVLADIGIPPEAYAPLGIDARGVFASGDLIRVATR